MNSSKEYDIAIIILEKKPPYTGNLAKVRLLLSFLFTYYSFLRLDFIRPICLPDLAENDLSDPDEILYVTGWGKTKISLCIKSQNKFLIKLKI